MTYFALRTPTHHARPALSLEPERQYSLPPPEQPPVLAEPTVQTPLAPTRSSSLPTPDVHPRQPRKLRKPWAQPPPALLAGPLAASPRSSISGLPPSAFTNRDLDRNPPLPTPTLPGALPESKILPAVPPSDGPAKEDGIVASLATALVDLSVNAASAVGEKITGALSEDGTWSTSLKNVGEGAGNALAGAVTRLMNWDGTTAKN